jgi:mycothiol synthase
VQTSTLTWRALATSDAAAVAALLAAAEEVDDTGEHYDESDVVEDMTDPALDLARDTLAAVAGDGAVLGYSVAFPTLAVRDVDRVRLFGTVLPAARGRGLGRRLVEWGTARAAEQHRELHPDLPGEVLLHVPDSVPTAAALARAAGYEPVRWWYDMRRDLTAPLPELPPAPAGLALVPYSADRNEQLRLAHIEAFAGHWGSTPPDPERWGHWYTGAQAFRPELSWLVLDTGSDEIAGYLNAYHFPAATAATGVPEGYIGQIGVRDRWRRRGLGALLLAAALAGFREAGYERAALDVDTGNATGALSLYERAGFTVSHRSVTWSIPLG